MIRPRIEYEDVDAPRLEAAPIMIPVEPVRWGTAALALIGVAVLAIGFASLSSANFIADQFARGAWLGWITAAIALLGFGLVGTGVWRETRALLAIGRVDRWRADLASGEAERIMRAAQGFAATVTGHAEMAGALRAVNDPDAALALLRAGPATTLREGAEALSRTAAVQVVAGIAAMPSPALDILLVGWRGVRLVRQVAALYGVRPGTLGTIALLRRTALAATMVGAAEIAGNTVAHGLLSSPLLARAVGEAAGAGMAARRMLVLGRAAAAACDPVPPV